MMSFDLSAGIQDLLAGPPPNRDERLYSASQLALKGIVGEQRVGNYGRRMLQWRVPHIGWVKMFLNPEQMTISEGKDITDVRTKAGFILQYAGEKLTKISISGSTGSAGMEGINILREVYRAEQIAFDRIALELERNGPVAELLQLAKGGFDSSSDFGAQQGFSNAIQLALNIFSQPFPTLASLAVNIEMYFQGELFRGYFTDFKSTESAAEPGIFTYNLEFTAHSRQGIRRNFMPWHHQPLSPIGLSGADPNPLSFEAEEAGEPYTPGSPRFLPARNAPEQRGRGSDEPTPRKATSRRNLSSGSGKSGGSLTGLDLEDFI